MGKLQTDQSLLGKFITIPVPAERVKFEIMPIGEGRGFGPTDYSLIAVLYYSPEKFDRMVAGQSLNEQSFTFDGPDWLKGDDVLEEFYNGTGFVMNDVVTIPAEGFYSKLYMHGQVVALKKQHALLILFQTT